MLIRKQALLAKREVTYGVDPTPTGAANAMQVRNLRVRPIVMAREARELVKPYLGSDKEIVSAFWGELSYAVEAAGAGTAGGIPAYDPLHRSCGLAMVNSPGVDTVYTPISAAFESSTQYFYLDGVLHKFTGARGNPRFSAVYRSAPLWEYSFTGLFTPVVDAALPTAVLSAFVEPLAFNKANTPDFELHGISGLVLRSLMVDLGNVYSYRNMVNDESVRITDRKPTLKLEFGAHLVAVKNWVQQVQLGTPGEMALFHGTTAGNKVLLYAPAFRPTEIEYVDVEGDAFYSVSGALDPNAGNDEILFTLQ